MLIKSLKRPGKESDAESSRESSSDDLDGHPKNIQTNSRSQVDLNRLSLKDNDDAEILSLSSRCPDLNTYNSCDILPSSWVSVAWCKPFSVTGLCSKTWEVQWIG
ncbi:hypothetical protein Scep_024053 [Stephania cephalantha]|uniref:Uncharacterized protein n=1 Tax=Stephania cephalantha TaxID=152367 RepID=A0AAP0F1A4_9MAGN